VNEGVEVVSAVSEEVGDIFGGDPGAGDVGNGLDGADLLEGMEPDLQPLVLLGVLVCVQLLEVQDAHVAVDLLVFVGPAVAGGPPVAGGQVVVGQLLGSQEVALYQGAPLVLAYLKDVGFLIRVHIE